MKISHTEPTAKKPTAHNRIDRQQLARDIAAFAHAAESPPVSMTALVEHFGISRSVIAEGAAIALREGTIRSVTAAGPKLSGYYPVTPQAEAA